MEWLKSACYFLAVLSVLVVVHEWGHFMMAKLCKMRVEDFSLFFGKRLIRLGVRNGTEYNIRAIPLGGFVKIAGMEPDDISNGAPIFKKSGSPSEETPKILQGLHEETLENIPLENVSGRIRNLVESAIGPDAKLTESGKLDLQQALVSTSINADEHRYIEAILGAELSQADPDGYNQKPLWQRAITIFAGPFMSLFFGYALFCIMGFTTGLPDMEHADSTIGAVAENKAAYRGGLHIGDKIVEINGAKVTEWNAMADIIHANAGRPVNLVVLREKAPLHFTITPDSEPVTVTENGKKVKKIEGRLNIGPSYNTAWKRYTPWEAVRRGTQLIYAQITGTIQGLFSRNVGDNVGGIITIGRVIHDNSKEGPRNVLFTAAMLSVSLGLVNLFPIPILDGGHLLLLFIEFIRRRKLSSREVYAAQMVGISIIGVLFVLVMYNDISRLPFFSGKP